MNAAAATFLTRIAEPLYSQLAENSTVESQLDELWAAAREAWPQLVVDRDVFFAHVAERLPGDAGPEVLGGLFAADLYLACACYLGDSRAIGFCEESNAGDLRRGFDSLNATPTLRDEAMQVMRERLFVGSEDNPPAIGSFSGKGSLRKWLRVAATRTALNVLRKHKREVGLEHAPDLPDAAADLELGHLKRTYQAAFKVAFAEALAELSPKQRGLLRWNLLDKLSIDDIGRLESVHRTTAARWLREAREALAHGTRERMRDALQIGTDELESVMRLVRSRLDVSITRNLGV